MKYDKIRGKSVAECMMKLRSAFGSSAIILSTREVQEGGLLGSGLFSRKLYEIDFMLPEEGGGASRPLIAGGSRDRQALKRVLLDAAREGVESRSAPASVGSGSRPSDGAVIPPLPGMRAGVGVPTKLPTTGEELKLEREALNLLLADADLPAYGSAAEATPATESEPMQASRSLTGGQAGVDRGPGMSEFRQNAGSTGERPEDRPVAGTDDADDRFGRILHRIRGRLLSSQVSNDFADRFLKQVDHSLSRQERAEYRNVEERSLEKLAEVIRTVPDIAPRHGECQAVMLFGPTGSGKTTSLAKLAARYHIMQGREVSIYSLDHYRLAATEQLKTYAGVMDVPFFAPLSPRDFAEYLRRDGAELMLIDTSGIGYRDSGRIEQLREYVQACEVRLEKHLVLAANTNAAMLEKILLAYDRIGFDKIILTKLDESDFLGAFIELADKYNRPFSFLMNGQDVPGSILEAKPLELARMVLGGPGSDFEKASPGDPGISISSGI
jgi:flagellar biosynthesis protein FlhF